MPGAHVLHREVNGGQGASLKHGIAWIKQNLPGIAWLVTADADGQHLPEDIVEIFRAGVEDPGRTPVFGVREFDESVPARSRFGNRITSRLVRLLYGHDVPDTQTGLRGLPPRLFDRLLAIGANRFQFNSEVLLVLLGEGNLHKVPISTVYEPGNPSSHFRPVMDSLQIYAVLLRYAVVMLLVALLEYANLNVFSAILDSTFAALVLAKAVSVVIAFGFLRRFIFKSDMDIRRQAVGFLVLSAFHLLTVWLLITVLTGQLGLPLYAAALLAYSTMFVVVFILQRRTVFVRRAG